VRLRYTSAALADLDEILDYIATHSPQGARRVQRRIFELIELLAARPNIGRRTNDPSIRRLNARPYPYLVFYEATEDEVIIHAVRHSARDPAGMPGAS